MKRHSKVKYPNCAGKMLLGFEVNCTGQSIKYTLMLSLEGNRTLAG